MDNALCQYLKQKVCNSTLMLSKWNFSFFRRFCIHAKKGRKHTSVNLLSQKSESKLIRKHRQLFHLLEQIHKIFQKTLLPRTLVHWPINIKYCPYFINNGQNRNSSLLGLNFYSSGISWYTFSLDFISCRNEIDIITPKFVSSLCFGYLDTQLLGFNRNTVLPGTVYLEWTPMFEIPLLWL